jgi:YidC/Oxa1 family membrane protein insertase
MHLFYVWTWPLLNLLGKLLEMLSQALLAALIYFKSVTGSYGIGIIILTVIVRAAVWWPTQKANNSMRKMQKIQPLVQELREKYKDNPQVMNQKVMALYKEHKVNPLGGCLPIFLQMPVFLALFCAFSGAVELRHESFLWCSDLCQPDNIGSILGIQIHPLVLVMTGLMVFQQKLTPSAADPAQQKMMMFMPLVMLLFFYDMPSGLTLYWTVSQIISIIQLLINRHISNREEEKAGATA